MTNDKKYDSTYSILLDILNEVEQGGSGAGIPDAPVDGKTYGRNNANWVEVTSGGDLIEVVVPKFDFRNDPVTISKDIAPGDKLANIEAANKIIATINAGKSPNVMLKNIPGRYTPPYFTPWKVLIYADKVQIIALQDSFRGKNEIVGYSIEDDGSITSYTSWSGADTRNLKTINGESIVGKGDILVATKQYVDDLVGTANNKLNLI